MDIADEIVIEGDAGRLIQVMVNLLSNAINYSKEQTKVTVSVKKMRENVIIEVQDEGIGIEQLNWHGCLNVFIVSTVLEAVIREGQVSD